MKPAVCFHGERRCGFCRFPPPQVARHRLRCSCCGRFVRRPGKVVPIITDRCPTCTSRGFEALRLF